MILVSNEFDKVRDREHPCKAVHWVPERRGVDSILEEYAEGFRDLETSVSLQLCEEMSMDSH